MRSLHRQDARGFAEYLGRQSRRTNILAPSGKNVIAIQTDKQRVNSSGMHIPQGLYFQETGKPLSREHDVRVASKAELTAEHPDLTIARVFYLFPDQRNGAMGTAFSYAAAFGHSRSVWLMLLYDYFFWIGSIDERDVA